MKNRSGMRVAAPSAMPLAALLLLASLLLVTGGTARAEGSLRLRLTVEAVPGLTITFLPEGQEPGVELAATDGQGHYSLQFTTLARGGILMLTQQGALVSRDPISWTYPPGTVADLIVSYQVDSLRNLVMTDFRRTGTNLRAADDAPTDPGVTPIALRPAPPVSPTLTLTSTTTLTSTPGVSGTSNQNGGLLFIVVGLVGFLVFGYGQWQRRKSLNAAQAVVGSATSSSGGRVAQ